MERKLSMIAYISVSILVADGLFVPAADGLFVSAADGLPNFGFNQIRKSEDFPSPMKDSGIIADLGRPSEYPELIYASESNRALIVDTEDLTLINAVETEGKIVRILAENLNNDHVSELIILSSLKIAVYSCDGELIWDRKLDSTGVDVGLIKDMNGDILKMVTASKDHFCIFSSNGDLKDSRQIDDIQALIIANINQTSEQEIILIHGNSVSAYFHNGAFIWKCDFAEPISAACAFSPPEKGILVSLEDGTFHSLNEKGIPSSIENVRSRTTALIPFRLDMVSYPAGFFAISPYGELRAYRYTGETIEDLTNLKRIKTVIPYDLDKRDTKSCKVDSYFINM